MLAGSAQAAAQQLVYRKTAQTNGQAKNDVAVVVRIRDVPITCRMGTLYRHPARSWSDLTRLSAHLSRACIG